jgi:hypothetical protein
VTTLSLGGGAALSNGSVTIAAAGVLNLGGNVTYNASNLLASLPALVQSPDSEQQVFAVSGWQHERLTETPSLWQQVPSLWT